MADTKIRTVAEQDLDRCFEIELAAFTGDEAASKEKILKRILAYPEGFIVMEADGQIVGFINSGAAHQIELSDEEFKELVGHDSNGEHVVILSVAVHPAQQGQGYAGQLMKNFIDRMKNDGKADIYLICQSSLVGLYAKYGFTDLGASESTHGGLSWNEMSLAL